MNGNYIDTINTIIVNGQVYRRYRPNVTPDPIEPNPTEPEDNDLLLLLEDSDNNDLQLLIQ